MGKRYVVCLKYGEKYSSTYVNKLYNMIQRNLTLDHEFVCFTDNDFKINKNIRVEPLSLEYDITGWWFKTLMFNPNNVLKGTILFLDLDLIIFKNINYLFTYNPYEFLIIRDFNRCVIRNYEKFNSSVFRLETGQHSYVYTEFMKNPKNVMNRFLGDQDWIRYSIKKNYEFWPDEWIQSYKWEMRNKSPLEKGIKGKRDFIKNGDPIIKKETSIAVFHGDPNPHNCKDQWVIDNWI